MQRGAKTRNTTANKPKQQKNKKSLSKRTLSTTKSSSSATSTSSLSAQQTFLSTLSPSTSIKPSIFTKSIKKMSSSPILNIDSAKSQGLSHEQGFDKALENLNQQLENTDDPLSLIKQQNKALVGQPAREWTVQDTLTVLPHVLQLIQPNAVFPRLAIHRIANLKAQLRTKNEEIIARSQKTLDEDDFEKAEIDRMRFVEAHTIDLIPIQDFVRVHMQVCLSSSQYVLLSYQNYCKNTFGFDQSGQQFFGQLLDHIESVPQLTFYRIHFHQSLTQLSSTLIGRDYDHMIDQMSKMTSDSMKEIFLKRFAFARSNAFRDALKRGFKDQNILADSTMLPLQDPVNTSKQQVMNQIAHQANVSISKEIGLDAIGHLLLEVELAMGVRFPKVPKHILHVKTLHTMTKIAKMPQNPQLQQDYYRIVNSLQTPSDLFSSDPNAPAEDSVKLDPTDSVNFIEQMEELAVEFPDELWDVPVSRTERAQFFKENPEAYQLWTIYSTVVNRLESINRYAATHEQFTEHVRLLEQESSKAGLSDAQRSDFDTKLSVRRKKIIELDNLIEKDYDALAILDQEYETKAKDFRKKMGIAEPESHQEMEEVEARK